MDGYAFAASSLKGMVTELPIVARVTAGSSGAPLPLGAAARIMTGAPIPNGADTVVMQEHVRRSDSTISIEGPIRTGSCIRRLGEDVAEGESLLAPGQRLDAPHLALLGAQGYAAIYTVRRPRVAILSTGDEIRRPGEALDASSVYDSNKPMLLALVRQAGLEVHDAGCVRDDVDQIARRLAEVAESCDLLITTGGASAGEEDHSGAALAKAGAIFEVLSIALKPGKPAVVGRIKEAVYLGLPGNPVSALVSWLTLGGAVVAALMGRTPRRQVGYPMRTASSLG
jgi:molybdopterin molybdotransferase